MNLLPKSHKEFGEKDYWNQFFKKRGNKAFEWYGEYLELCSLLHKYIKPTDHVLVPGCGNSSLSADLYDAGLKHITNIDVSEIAIKQMQRTHSQRTDMKYLNMDATKTSFDNESFNVVLDKGTLDALMPDESEETLVKIDSYFNEMKRLLKLGGRFVCVTLLQSHVLNKVLSVFGDKSWMLRIVRCHEAEAKNSENGDGTTLPVFLIVATKFKQMPQLVLEVCMAGDKMVRVQSLEEVRSCIKGVQDAAFITNGLAKTELAEDDEVCVELFRSGESAARYTLHVLDRRARDKLKYAVFVVPQGRESEWLFGTSGGRRKLSAAAGASRLAVASLMRGQTFDSLDAVKDELASAAATLAPPGFTGQIPFLSLGAEVSAARLVRRGRSAAAGEYVVEDVTCDAGRVLRRLVFMSDQFLVQSEATVRHLTVKGKTKTLIDFGDISLYHAYISAGVALATPATEQTRTRTNDAEVSRTAIIGLGGGGLAMFLRKCFGNLHLTAVDIDAEMLEIAQQDFQLKLDDKLQVKIQDGLEFMKEEAGKGVCWRCVVLDVDSKAGGAALACPPHAFLQDAALADAATMLAHSGHLIINVVCRDASLMDSLLITIKEHFKHIVISKLPEEVNQVVFATNSVEYTDPIWEEAVKHLNRSAKQKNLVKGTCVELSEFTKTLVAVS